MSVDANDASVHLRHHVSPVSRRRKYVKAVVILTLAVVAGFAIGVSTAVFYMKKTMFPRRPSTDTIAKEMVERMNTEVGLTAEERTRIDGIVRSHMEEVDKVRKSSFNLIWDQMDKMGVSVNEVLGPDRSRKWEDYKDKHFGHKRREFEERRRRNREHGSQHH